MDESFADILDDWLDARLQGVHTALPGTIETYDMETRLARVKPTVKMVTRAGDVVAIKPIDNVPVIFPGSANAGVTFPLEKGDQVYLVFAETGIGGWINGNADTDADTEARFKLTDAVAIPGLWQRPYIPKVGAISDGLVFFYKGTKITLKKDSFKVEDSAGVSWESISGGIKVSGNLEVSGDIKSEGNIEADLEVSANALTPLTKVGLSTHYHPAPGGATGSPTPGS